VRRHFWNRRLLSVPFLREPLRAPAPVVDPRLSSGSCSRAPVLRPGAGWSARRGSGGVRLDLGRGTGPDGLRGDESPALAAFIVQVTGPPHLPSAWMRGTAVGPATWRAVLPSLAA
jgi:hypothetical protein